MMLGPVLVVLYDSNESRTCGIATDIWTQSLFNWDINFVNY